MGSRVLVVDNYDSFTYNLVQMLGELGADLTVRRADAIGVDEARRLAPDRLVISPGPGRPEDAGASIDLVRALGPTTPTLGVCLGHQVVAVAFGGSVDRAPEPRHGKVSPIRHDGTGILAGLPSPFSATRYHSLAAVTMPDELVANAWSEDGVVQGIRHVRYPIHGVQFHPESILTEVGPALLSTFLDG